MDAIENERDLRYQQQQANPQLTEAMTKLASPNHDNVAAYFTLATELSTHKKQKQRWAEGKEDGTQLGEDGGAARTMSMALVRGTTTVIEAEKQSRRPDGLEEGDGGSSTRGQATSGGDGIQRHRTPESSRFGQEKSVAGGNAATRER